jgi:bifunctional non-homologous end joining protein LigD
VVWIAALALLDAGTCSRNSDVCFIKCPTGFILPALLTHEGRSAAVGPLWLHEIKHDGFRIIARKDGHRVRLYSRPGNDLTPRFPLIVEAVSRLRARSIIIDGESVACDDNGIPNFNRLRYCHHDDSVLLCAFDLIELNGDDLRREPLVTRKATLASVVAKASPGILLNEHFEHDGPTVFAHACKLCLEGIVSKRKDSPYRSGRSPGWLVSKNPASAAVRRKAVQAASLPGHESLGFAEDQAILCGWLTALKG